MNKFFTEKEIEIISAEYPFSVTADIAAKLDCEVASVYRKAYKLGLRKSQSYFDVYNAGRLTASDTRGLRHRFVKGITSWNKGSRGVHLSPDSEFKKGNVPANHRQVGTERVNEDGYVYIKIAEPATWVLLHRYNWEKANGPVPAGLLVKLRDGNRQNCEASNLYLGDRKTNMMQNTITRYPPELRIAMKQLKKLTKLIENGKKQN